MNDLDCAKEQIRVLEFRNAKLHQHNEKIEREILELRNKIKSKSVFKDKRYDNDYKGGGAYKALLAMFAKYVKDKKKNENNS